MMLTNIINALIALVAIVIGPKIWEDAVVGREYHGAFGFSLLPFVTRSTAM